MKNIQDIEVIESVLKGNDGDYAILIDKYKNKAFSLLCRMLNNNQEAEEVLQDCFLKAFYNLKSFRQEAKFSTWFYRIVYNTALSKLSQKKRKVLTEMSSIDDHLEIPDDAVIFEGVNLSQVVEKIIDKLPEKYSSVLTLFYMQDLSCEEISRVMNTTVQNVKVLLHRSRNAMKDYIIKNNLFEEIGYEK